MLSDGGLCETFLDREKRRKKAHGFLCARSISKSTSFAEREVEIEMPLLLPAIETIRNTTVHVGPNAACGCGSGKKNKKCCRST